jgi:hypothetical protein
MFGLARPLGHEPWHVQPLEGAPTPDNPDPNAKPMVADSKGKMINLETGKAEEMPKAEPMTAQQIPPVSESGGEAAAPVPPPPAAKQQAQPMAASAAPAPQPVAAPAAAPMAPEVTPRVAATPSVQPVSSQSGSAIGQQSSQLETSKMVAQTPAPAAPVVVNNQSGGGKGPLPQPPAQLQKASARTSESTFQRALARDFAHPTAFTTISMI